MTAATMPHPIRVQVPRGRLTWKMILSGNELSKADDSGNYTASDSGTDSGKSSDRMEDDSEWQ